jgi:hypothetical protein
MRRKPTAPKKNDLVIVTEGRHIGREGHVRTQKLVPTDKPDIKQVVLVLWCEPTLITVPRSHAARIEDLPIATLDRLRAERAAVLAKEADELANAEAARKARLRAEYVARRVATSGGYTTRCQTDREAETGYFRQIYDPFSTGPELRERIRVTARCESWSGMPEVTVNWSALGSASPDEALAFALALKQAAEHALDARASLEIEHALDADIETAFRGTLDGH